MQFPDSGSRLIVPFGVLQTSCFSRAGFSIGEKTIVKFLARATRLCEKRLGGALRLPPTWIVRAVVVSVDERNRSSNHSTSSQIGVAILRR